MGEWETLTLEELVSSPITYGVVKPGPADENGVKLIRGGDVLQGKIAAKLRTITSELSDQFKRTLLEGGELVVSLVGNPGEVALVPEELKGANLARQVGLVRLSAEISSKYVMYYLISPLGKNELDSLVMGSVQQVINLRDLKQVKISFPEPEEQKAIAGVLSCLDKKIDLLHRQNKTLESLAETLFRQTFIEEAQDDWEEKPLDDLLTVTSSKRIFYKEYVTSGVPFYRSKEIIELHNTGSTKGELFITSDRFQEIEQKFGAPQHGDILLTSVGTLGVPYRVKANDHFYFKDGNLTWFKEFKKIPSIIVYCWLKSKIGKVQLDAITIGSTQAALTISGLKGIVLKLPPAKQLKELEGSLNELYNKVEQNHLQIQTLKSLRDILLPKLMSGEVRVQYDEAA